jgi:beta-mannosidase
VGFKHVEWRPCAGAPEHADPWLCVVNGQEVFLQGLQLDADSAQLRRRGRRRLRQRLELYRDLHVTVLRVWGGAFLEKEIFYDLCDELGLLVWQEFPLSSSGIDNYAPMTRRASLPCRHRALLHRAAPAPCRALHLVRRQRAAERPGWRAGRVVGSRWATTHPLLKAALRDMVAELDPTRRFLPTSASGPSFRAMQSNGQGVHWDVHGPWRPETDPAAIGGVLARRRRAARSEVGAPGPSSADLIRRYAGDVDPFPGTYANPLWRRTSWWIEWPQFVAEMGREPESLEEYVAWGQERQARACAIAAGACKARFPACGGFIVWMGHDSYPCTANTSVIDFEGNPKPAAFALADVFRQR